MIGGSMMDDLAEDVEPAAGALLRRNRRRLVRVMGALADRRAPAVDHPPTTAEVTLFNPTNTGTTRYRYRGTAIPSPWLTATT
ncbi:MAG TPA: hypothetical protein VGQ26_02130 [Streptosporangiaceae bacterium]|jgi:hypothetical protein|nr:hypothetical protein [Streptosporangiaceae bacterium]